MKPADQLALARAVAVLPVVTLIALHQDAAGGGLFAFAALTDALDGPIARARGEATAFGAALDPLADKILVVGTLAALALRGLVPGVALAVIVARELAAVWVRSRSPVALPATGGGKAKTVAQTVAIVGLLVAAAMRSTLLTEVANGLLAVAVALTIVSGLKLMRRAAQTAPHAR